MINSLNIAISLYPGNLVFLKNFHSKNNGNVKILLLMTFKSHHNIKEKNSKRQKSVLINLYH